VHGIEEQDQTAAAIQTVRLQIPVSDFVIAAWQRRKWLATVTGVGSLIFIAISFLIPPEFRSTAQLMPINPESFTSAPPLDMLNGSMTGALMRQSSLMSTVTPGATAIGVLGSRTELDEIIKKSNLMSVYHLKTFEDSRKTLLKRTKFTEDKNSGIVTIEVEDRDRFRAQAIAQEYVEELNHLLETLNTSSAHRERIFLEARLKSLKVDLDASENELGQFSSKSGTLNPVSQSQTLIASASQLQFELTKAEAQLQGLREMYSDDNVRVKEARAGVDELRRQVQEMGAQENDRTPLSGKPYPSMRQLPMLQVTYLDLSRQLATEDDTYKVLTKQYELAQVQEVKELPTIKILDQPEVAERRASPRRTIIAILGMFFSLLIGIAWILAGMVWANLDESHPTKATLARITQSISS
jgi:uncharacterized protein involved in exopolysaccharide biosynthesis